MKKLHLTFIGFLLFFVKINCNKIHHQRNSQNLAYRHLQPQTGSSTSNVYRYEPIHLLEEPPIGTLIIDLGNKLGLNLDTSDYKFRFYSPQSVVSNYFLIDQLTGHVKTQRTIDREYLCETKICGQCLTSNCTLTLEIVATLPFKVNSNNNSIDNLPKQKFVSFDVIIEDKNEFAPQFSQSVIVLNVSEAAPLNFQIPIEGAIDRDSQFTQISYSLAPLITKSTENNNNIVNDEAYVDSERYANEMKKLNSKIKLSTSTFSNQLNLIIVEPFDYEYEKEYSFKILATDNGWPALTGTCVVKLNIIDVNDNLPVFDRQEYEYRIDEGVPAGTRLVRVHATDRDDGVNALIKYSFTEQVVPSQLSSLMMQSPSSATDSIIKFFSIDENTGWISSNAMLDYEYQSIYRLVVKAQDQGINSMPVYASVIIYLNDLNDNPPVINLTVPDDLYRYEDNCLYISEWTVPGTFLTQIIVNDADSGLNGKVDIDLQEKSISTNEYVESSTFFIEHLFNNFYSLILKQAIDRESVSEYNLVIRAHDYGKPMLSSNKHLKVSILDENDNQPKFIYPNSNETFYKFSIFETNGNAEKKNNNTDKWLNIGKVNCIDLDSGENGRVSYSLVSPYNETLFQISESTGDLFVLQNSIDRELHNLFELEVICQDNGLKKKLSAVALVQIFVLDLNDNKPVFERNNYVLSVDENLHLFTKITQFHAADADEPFTFNSKINYKIIDKSTDSKVKITDVFSINKETGELYLIKSLDYEIEKYYEFYVVANDFGEPQQESDKILVRIDVVDVNDNSPKLLWPMDDDLPLIFNLNQLYENYVQLFINNKFELFNVNAVDEDSNENGILKFSIEKQQKLNFRNDDTNQFRTNIHMFECDSNNGTINGLFFKRFKNSIQAAAAKPKQQIVESAIKSSNLDKLFEELIGIYYLEIKIQDSPKLNPLHINRRLFLVLNTNTTSLDDDVKLLKNFLNQTIDNDYNNDNNEVQIQNLRKYVHNSLNIKWKASANSLSEYVDENGLLENNVDSMDSHFLFLNSLFSFSKSNNKNIELLFGANYRFILLIITISVIIVLFLIIAVSVVVCYRRKKALLSQRKKKLIEKSNLNTNCSKGEVININNNLLSSLIDITSQSSSEDNENKKLNNLSTTSPTTELDGLQATATLKRVNKLRATINEYDLNISSEDQTALLLYSNSPASSASSTTSHRHTPGSSASTTSNQTHQTNASKKTQELTHSSENINEPYNNLRTFKNVSTTSPSALTPKKTVLNVDIDANINNTVNEKPINNDVKIYNYQQINELKSRNEDHHKYFTLPVNRLSQCQNENLVNDDNLIGTLRAKPNFKITLNNGEINYSKINGNNELYSFHSMAIKIKEPNETTTTTAKNNEDYNKVDYEILNRNKYQNKTSNLNENNNNSIPEHFFKNKKEFKKLVYKNNLIDCKHLELSD